MRNHLCLLMLLLLFASISGCERGRESANSTTTSNPQSKSAATKTKGSATLNGVEYPVYPNAELLQNLLVSVAYHVDAEPSEVRNWYDKEMAAEGWRYQTDWVNFGGQMQKDFLRGKALKNSAFAEEMVKLGISPHKKGGTHLMLMPIVNKYQAK